MLATVCVHSIVKNEESVVRRMLDSVAPFASQFYVADTGSTDSTVPLLRDYLLLRKGTVVSIPFTDFATTRNEALKRVRTDCEWIMLMDADMTFHGTLGDDIPEDVDVVRATHQRNGLRYLRILMVRASVVDRVRYEGPTHEVLKTTAPSGKIITLAAEAAWVQDGGDGGNSAEKLARDLRLLHNATTPRCVFYLGETHRYLGNHVEAISAYKRRVGMGGDDKEALFYSCYQIGRGCLLQDREGEARHWMQRAMSYNPRRAEPFYHLARWGAARRKWNTALLDITRSSTVREPDQTWLFVEVDVYRYLRDIQRLVIEYYTGLADHESALSRSCRILDSGEMAEEWRGVVHNNLVYFAPRVVLPRESFRREGEFHEEKGWFWSSPTFSGETVLIRINNYEISESGEYLWGDPRYCECRTVALMGDGRVEELARQAGSAAVAVVYGQRRVRGLEDVRLFRWKDDEVWFTAVTEDMVPEPGKRRMVMGVYRHPHLCVEHVMDSPYEHDTEKNWGFFVSRNQLRCVYRWWPLEFGTIAEGQLRGLRESSQEPPGIFRFMRGSTHGQPFRGLVYFVTHSVATVNGMRHYMHYLVAVCPRREVVVGYGGPFRLTGGPVEFVLGLSVNEDSEEISVGYSRNDRTTCIGSDSFYSFLTTIGFRYTLTDDSRRGP